MMEGGDEREAVTLPLLGFLFPVWGWANGPHPGGDGRGRWGEEGTPGLGVRLPGDPSHATTDLLQLHGDHAGLLHPHSLAQLKPKALSSLRSSSCIADHFAALVYPK